MNGNLTTDLCMQEKSFGQGHQSGDRHIIYFSSGETLEESECEEDDDEDASLKEPFSQTVDTANLSWKEYSWFLGKHIGKKSLQTCEYLGGKLACVFGLDAAKYQYAVDEFNRDEKVDSGAFVEDDAEKINLAHKSSRKYGATSRPTPEVPCTKSSISDHSEKHSAIGTNNKGYQDDD